MGSGGRDVLAEEGRWQVRAGISALVGALIALAGFILLQTTVGGATNFEGLGEAHDHSFAIWVSGVATTVGYLLLTGPLLFLFRAAQSRSPRVRNQLVGVVILGPLLLGVSAFSLAVGTQQAASTYLNGNAESTLSTKEAREECVKERKEKGASFVEEFKSSNIQQALRSCESKKSREDEASNAIRSSSMVKVGQFTGLVGGLALVIGLFYSCLWAMRVGLLARFWGSLGMAVGVAALIGLTPFALFWFVYLGLLLIGRVPGGRPPAWAAGEAVPWPTPGQKAAESLAPPEAGDLEGGGGEVPELRKGSEGEAAPPARAARPKKRKQRDSGEQ